MQKAVLLRKKHPRFIYKGYSYKLAGNQLLINFGFQLEPDIYFKPEIIIRGVSRQRFKKIGKKALNNFVFHLGLMEMLNYWKTACSPEIVVRAGFLDKEQEQWWHDLIIQGMGQFFYENKIDYTEPEFLKITSNPKIEAKALENYSFDLKNRYLVAFAGGRDSIITLEKLKKKEIALFSVNPTKQILKTAKVSGIKKQILIERKIDSTLLRLNKEGYLNGHTPFTALLSFLSVFAGVLFDYQNVVFSNEKSADEGNVKYLGKIVNHQWAKSSEFEKQFKTYCQKYLADKINYLNFVRRYGELQISKIFVKYPKYFPVFSSCNVSMRITPPKAKAFRRAGARWCNECPKCLFVYATLYPYLEKKQLLQIFGQDIFQNRALLPTMYALLGRRSHKPFECVGTYKESRLAFDLSLEKAKKTGELPYLLTKLNAGRT